MLDTGPGLGFRPLRAPSRKSRRSLANRCPFYAQGRHRPRELSMEAGCSPIRIPEESAKGCTMNADLHDFAMGTLTRPRDCDTLKSLRRASSACLPWLLNRKVVSARTARRTSKSKAPNRFSLRYSHDFEFVVCGMRICESAARFARFGAFL